MSEILFPALLNRVIKMVNVRANKEIMEAIKETGELLGIEGDWTIDIEGRRFVKEDKNGDTGSD